MCKKAMSHQEKRNRNCTSQTVLCQKIILMHWYTAVADSTLRYEQWVQWFGRSSHFEFARSADCQLRSFIFTDKIIVLQTRQLLMVLCNNTCSMETPANIRTIFSILTQINSIKVIKMTLLLTNKDIFLLVRGKLHSCGLLRGCGKRWSVPITRLRNRSSRR